MLEVKISYKVEIYIGIQIKSNYSKCRLLVDTITNESAQYLTAILDYVSVQHEHMLRVLDRFHL